MLWLSLREEEQRFREAPNTVFSGSGPALHSCKEEREKKDVSQTDPHQPSGVLPKSLEHEDKDCDKCPTTDTRIHGEPVKDHSTVPAL